MPDETPEPLAERPPPEENWDQDPWKEADAWDKDDWKTADWGEPPVAPSARLPPGRRKGGAASYGKGMIEAGPYLSLGTQVAFGLVFFVGIGYAVDRWWNSTPWGMIVGAMLGMVAVFTLVVRMARDEDAKRKARRQAKGR